MRLGIFEVLKKTSELPSLAERVAFLRSQQNGALLTVLKFTLDPNVEWDLPESDPPYKPNIYPAQEHMLMSEARRLYLFIKGGNPNLKQSRREALYIELLEAVHPEDAILLNHAKCKKFPYKNITVKLVNEAFPGLLEDKRK